MICKKFLATLIFSDKHLSIAHYFYKFIIAALFFLSIYSLISCSSSKRFTTEKKIESEKNETTERNISSGVRVLLEENSPASFITIQNDVYLFREDNKIAAIRKNNTLQCYNENYMLRIIIQDKEFNGDSFKLVPVSDTFVQINGKKYNGVINLIPAGQTVGVVNQLSLEDYVKGVLTKEMPVGNGDENLEALKALAICIRTYAMNRINEGNSIFDLFKDTRDQVYGGLDAEHPTSNKAVEATEGLFLLYNDKPAIIYYHSTCGGVTESAENVFTKEKIPYLKSVVDGNPANCSISGRFSWKENYSNDIILKRLYANNLIDDGNYSVEEININSRFSSGRVNELEILLSDSYNSEKSVKLYGNGIRNILKTSDGSMILWSNLFDVNKSGSNISISGHGFGHGVGLCQWGAINLSRNGSSYSEILEFYYSGTTIGKLND